MPTYFEFLWNGPVYMLKVPEKKLRDWVPVRLPDNTMVRVRVREDCYPEAEFLPSSTYGHTRTLNATLVIGEGQFTQTFDAKRNPWKKLVPMIIAATAVNTLFTVILAQTEYERLHDGEFDRLRNKLPGYVADRLMLLSASEVWNDTGNLPALEVVRHGRHPY